MDFADATLVVLAEELDTSLVDRTDFSVYRIKDRKAFRTSPSWLECASNRREASRRHPFRRDL